jgi:amino acid permease
MGAYRSFILPTALLAGTIIGAGIFSLPYVFVKAGVGLSFIFLGIFGLVYVAIHLMYGDLVIKNGDEHRFAGLAKIYFGKLGYRLSVLMTVVEMFFVLTIYLVLSSSFISLVAPNLPVVYQAVIFWWIGSIIIFSGTKRLAFFELLAIVGILAAIIAVACLGLPHFFEKSFVFSSSLRALWLLPFGALLFAISGRPAIPSVIHYFRRIGVSPEKSKSPIIWGTLIPVIVYGAFVAGVLGLSGTVTPDAVTGVVEVINSPALIAALAILGVLSLISSYFAIGLDVFSSLQLDLKFSKKFSMFLVIILPLFIYFLDLGSFIVLVGIVGGLFIGLEGIMILAMWSKMKKGLSQAGVSGPGMISLKSPIIKIFLYAVFGVSIAYVLYSQIFDKIF